MSPIRHGFLQHQSAIVPNRAQYDVKSWYSSLRCSRDMAKKTIHPTTHAIERFGERILPLLPSSCQPLLSEKQHVRNALYALGQGTQAHKKKKGIVQVLTFFTVVGHPPIPLTLVIDTAKSTIITLYLCPSWENVGSVENPKWRCLQ